MSFWARYQPTEEVPWNWRCVVHLHRRAAFGATWNRIERDVDDDPESVVERVINGDEPQSRGDFEEMSEIIGSAAISSGEPIRLQAWWIYRMMMSPHPLREKLTLLWHNHFATSNIKVRSLDLMKQQNELLRRYATGAFGQLLAAVIKDPAILVWLDANSNRRGRPNENLARELMELFTLGIGNYSEDDIKNVAKALTGWTVSRGTFRWNEDRHEIGQKTILGCTRAFDGDSLIELLLGHGATSRRMAWRLCTCFMGEGVANSKAIDELAAGLRENDLDTGWAVQTILHSQLFFSNANINSRVSSPVEFILGTIRSLELIDNPPSSVILAEWCSRMGQELFYPPNVGGWGEGRSWLTSRTIIARSNFALALSEGQLRSPTEKPAMEQLLLQRHGQQDLDSAVGFFGRLLCGTELERSTRDPLLSDAATLPEAKRVNRLVARLLSQPCALVT